MVLPLIPIIAGGAIAAGSATLTWYYSLSKSDKESANIAVGDVLAKARSKLSQDQVLLVLAQCSEILYGTNSIDTLMPKQLREAKDVATIAIQDSNDDFERAMKLAKEFSKNR